jgi:hypothetical protein
MVKQLTPDDYAPKSAKDISRKEIAYAYPSSPRAEYFGAGKTGCWFVQFNGGNAHSGPFESMDAAEKWADERFPTVPYGFYSMNRFRDRTASKEERA